MRKLLLLLLLPGLMIACDPIDDGTEPLTSYQPVLMNRAVLEASISIEQPRDLVNPSRIYTYRDYIFVTELFEGVHIINNANPAAPVNESFVLIPGCQDIAIKNGILYADNSVDLVALDISNPQLVQETTRIRNAMPEPAPPGSLTIPREFRDLANSTNQIIVKWEKVK